MRRALASAWQAWERFWFEADGREQVRAFRLGLGMLLFFCYAIRSFDLELFFGESGIMPLAILDEVAPMAYRWTLLSSVTSPALLWGINLAFLASLLAVALAPRPRVAVVIAWALHLSFVRRNLAISYGVDMVACFFLAFLCLADFRAEGSKQRYRAGDLRATLGSMAYRLFQIQVCVIYAYSGLKKLKGATWWNGEAFWFAMTQTEVARMDFSWLAHFPLTVAFLTYATLAWEIYFPALIWFKAIRKPFLAIGVFLHLGIALGINLVFFAALMILSYVFFLDSKQVAQGWGRLMPRSLGRLAKKSSVRA